MIMGTFMRKLVGRVVSLLGYRPKKKWKDIEYFNPDWNERIKFMSKYVDSELSVTDLGCGKMWLKEYLTKDVKYIPVDYISRGEETIVCDFNKYEYPNVKSEIAFVSGCLEYVSDYEWFVKQISKYHKKCIVSYCVIENFPNINDRIKKTWVNNLSELQVLDLFERNGFKLKEKESLLNMIFVFEK